MKYEVGQKYQWSEDIPVGLIIASSYRAWIRIDTGMAWESVDISNDWEANDPVRVVYVPPEPLKEGQEITYDDLERLPKGSVVHVTGKISGSIRVWIMRGGGQMNFMNDSLTKPTNDGHWALKDLDRSKKCTLKLLHLPKD